MLLPDGKNLKNIAKEGGLQLASIFVEDDRQRALARLEKLAPGVNGELNVQLMSGYEVIPTDSLLQITETD
jgi:hypothetical protein